MRRRPLKHRDPAIPLSQEDSQKLSLHQALKKAWYINEYPAPNETEGFVIVLFTEVYRRKKLKFEVDFVVKIQGRGELSNDVNEALVFDSVEEAEGVLTDLSISWIGFDEKAIIAPLSIVKAKIIQYNEKR